MIDQKMRFCPLSPIAPKGKGMNNSWRCCCHCKCGIEDGYVCFKEDFLFFDNKMIDLMTRGIPSIKVGQNNKLLSP